MHDHSMLLYMHIHVGVQLLRVNLIQFLRIAKSVCGFGYPRPLGTRLTLALLYNECAQIMYQP